MRAWGFGRNKASKGRISFWSVCLGFVLRGRRFVWPIVWASIVASGSASTNKRLIPRNFNLFGASFMSSESLNPKALSNPNP